MKTITQLWSKLKYWQKGISVGFLGYILYFIIIVIVPSIWDFNCGFIAEHIPCSATEYFAAVFFMFVAWLKYGVLLIIAGGVIGSIMDYLKR
ncbi:MAG: hypothetical protein ISS25_03270 [Nanoarchaeota archaeon]|nr:hypothetical protein [DPANN group archaeon]MBL7116822.1 hypothetical protein [Nanoarchaeota archaeon]